MQVHAWNISWARLVGSKHVVGYNWWDIYLVGCSLQLIACAVIDRRTLCPVFWHDQNLAQLIGSQTKHVVDIGPEFGSSPGPTWPKATVAVKAQSSKTPLRPRCKSPSHPLPSAALRRNLVLRTTTAMAATAVAARSRALARAVSYSLLHRSCLPASRRASCINRYAPSILPHASSPLPTSPFLALTLAVRKTRPPCFGVWLALQVTACVRWVALRAAAPQRCRVREAAVGHRV